MFRDNNFLKKLLSSPRLTANATRYLKVKEKLFARTCELINILHVRETLDYSNRPAIVMQYHFIHFSSTWLGEKVHK